MNLSRRQMLGAAATLPFTGGCAGAAESVTITIDPRARLRTIPADYMGLGYEISSVAVPGLLSGKNQTYVQLVKNLGPRGVIRIGGNTSDFSSYDARGEAKSLPKGTVTNEANLRELRSFLDAVGWRLIWGLNLGSDKLDNAVDGSDSASVQTASNGLTPGSLVQSMPGAPDIASIQLGFADMSATDATGTPDASDDPAGNDIGQMLASIEQSRINMLKPTPAQAKLAYLMLSLPQVN